MGSPEPGPTTRSPRAAFPGEIPRSPSGTAKATPTSSTTPRTSASPATTWPSARKSWYAASTATPARVQAISRSIANA